MPSIRHKVLNQTISYRVLAKLANGTIPLDMDDAFEAANIVKVHVPQLAGVDDGTSAGCSGVIRFHKRGAKQLQAVFAEIEKAGLKHLILSFAGSYYPRMIRGAKVTPSEHSFGTALDINAAWNGLNRTPAPKGFKGSVIPLVPIFEKHGFRWGGTFRRADGMHFELSGLIVTVAPKPQPLPEAPLLVWNGIDYPVLFDGNGKPHPQLAALIEKNGEKVIATTNSLDQNPPRFYVNSRPVK